MAFNIMSENFNDIWFSAFDKKPNDVTCLWGTSFLAIFNNLFSRDLMKSRDVNDLTRDHFPEVNCEIQSKALLL